MARRTPTPASNAEFECLPIFPLCDDEPCKGHRVTHHIDLVARVLAIKDGWDRIEDSDQTEDYWRTGAELIAAIEEAKRRNAPPCGCAPPPHATPPSTCPRLRPSYVAEVDWPEVHDELHPEEVEGCYDCAVRLLARASLRIVAVREVLGSVKSKDVGSEYDEGYFDGLQAVGRAMSGADRG